MAKPYLEGPRDEETQVKQEIRAFVEDVVQNIDIPQIEPEPPLSVDQISSIEQEIGAGLIEEVIQVAEGERQLVDTLAEAKVYVLLSHIILYSFYCVC
jgi:NADH dehydrogenase (ubiquinone) 1 alpha subcomplex subunit 5